MPDAQAGSFVALLAGTIPADLVETIGKRSAGALSQGTMAGAPFVEGKRVWFARRSTRQGGGELVVASTKELLGGALASNAGVYALDPTLPLSVVIAGSEVKKRLPTGASAGARKIHEMRISASPNLTSVGVPARRRRCSDRAGPHQGVRTSPAGAPGDTWWANWAAATGCVDERRRGCRRADRSAGRCHRCIGLETRVSRARDSAVVDTPNVLSLILQPDGRAEERGPTPQRRCAVAWSAKISTSPSNGAHPEPGRSARRSMACRAGRQSAGTGDTQTARLRCRGCWRRARSESAGVDLSGCRCCPPAPAPGRTAAGDDDSRPRYHGGMRVNELTVEILKQIRDGVDNLGSSLGERIDRWASAWTTLRPR